MVFKTLALIYGFLLYLKPVKVQCYRITHVHNYHSFCSMTIFWKILYLILFGPINDVHRRQNLTTDIFQTFELTILVVNISISRKKNMFTVVSRGHF